jgi:hypothetical protein
MIGFFRYAFSIPKLNREPEQHELAQLFIECAEGRKSWEAIFDFLVPREWPRDERELRITHALSLVKVQRRDLYAIASEHGRAIMGSARQMEDADVDKISLDQMEKISEEVVNLILQRGVRTYHTVIEILMTTVIGLLRRMPAGNEREQTKKALIAALQKV